MSPAHAVSRPDQGTRCLGVAEGHCSRPQKPVPRVTSLSSRTTVGCRTPNPGLTDWATGEVSCRDRITASSGDVVFLTTKGGNETLFELLLACRSGEMQRDGWNRRQK